jgi:hypothetical protein
MTTPNSDIPGILRLNPEVRHRIYLHAGLGYANHWGETAPAVYDLGSRYGAFHATKTDYERQEGFRLFYGLLLSCRTIYAEASALLYSANCFIIRYKLPQRSLGPVRALTSSAVASLTHLKVVLNVASCHLQRDGSRGDGGCCQDATGPVHASALACSDSHAHDYDFSLDGSGPLGDRILGEWQATASYLASHIVPGRLELSLVCDLHPKDVEFARRVVNSLRLLPRLKDCHVEAEQMAGFSTSATCPGGCFTGPRYCAVHAL